MVLMGLTVSRKTAKNFLIRRKNGYILTVSRKKKVNREKVSSHDCQLESIKFSC